MRSRGVVGRRIVEVRHRRYSEADTLTLPHTVVTELVLDDGSVLRTHAYETDQEPIGDLLHVKAPSKRAHSSSQTQGENT